MEQRRRRNQQLESPPEADNQQQPEQEKPIKLWRSKPLPNGGEMIVLDGFRHD